MKSTAEATQVHTGETTGRLSTHQSYQAFRRDSCPEEFIAAQSMYTRLDERDELQRLKQLESCRNIAWFVRNIDTGKVHVASNSCRLRWCPICSRAKSMYISHSIKPWIESLQTSRFLTLTLKHTNAPLSSQIDKLYADFRKLRKDTQFKKLCVGGVWFFQIKLSTESQQWHPHLHCILAGKYIAHEWLSNKWRKITQTSNVVDIRMVRDSEKASNEIARYAASPAELTTLDSDRRVEVFDAMHGRRMCGSWGIAKLVSLSPPRSVDGAKYEDLGSYCIVVGLADTDESARKIYLAWTNDIAIEQGINMRKMEAWLNNRPYQLKRDVELGKYAPILPYT